MAITQSELDRFHEFAIQRIEADQADLDLQELIVDWDSARHRTKIDAATREGRQDIAAGRTRSETEVTGE